MTAAHQTRRPLLDWLLQRFPDTPRKRAKQWIAAGRVRVGGKVLRKPHELLDDPGASLEFVGDKAVRLECEPEWPVHPQLSLLYLDSSIAVVNKAAGLLSMPPPHPKRTALGLLADFLSGRMRVSGCTLPAVLRGLHPQRVHRLDQFTSGALCFALNGKARANLIEQFSAHTVGREYIAYVDGRPKTERGTWRHWLQMSRDGLRQFVVPKKADEETVQAITHFEVVGAFVARGTERIITKLRLRLETGRKHQIRAQAAHEGVPLVGDRVYNPRPGSFPFPRQALHAELLALDHPEQPGKRMTWRAVLPRDLRQLEAACQRAEKLLPHG
jgi:23S rRNA pseudouridine1911/1915/1917 synthase